MDPLIPMNYNVTNFIEGKAACKLALQVGAWVNGVPHGCMEGRIGCTHDWLSQGC